MLALVVSVATVALVLGGEPRNAAELRAKYYMTDKDWLVCESRAYERMLIEESEARDYYKSGVDDLVAGSTTAQHRQVTATLGNSIKMAEHHRIFTLSVDEAVKLRSVPDKDVRDLLLSGFGPHLDCGNNSVCCENTYPFRTANGRCNNLLNPNWGESFIPFRRFMEPRYGDGIASPRTMSTDGVSELPSARLVSTTIHEASTPATLSDNFTLMLMTWGQFLDHDVTLTPVQLGAYGSGVSCCASPRVAFKQARLSARPQCFPIMIPHGDPSFNNSCMDFVRSVQVENANCQAAPVEQLNQLTAYLDASQVYGSTQQQQNSLRTFQKGLLRTYTSTTGRTLLPKQSATDAPNCVTNSGNAFCFQAGDERVNENPALTSMQTVFLRFHNLVATDLKRLNCHWGDEKLFQETRRIIGASIQVITYTEYLPILLGPTIMTQYGLTSTTSGYANVYNPAVDASIRNAFSTAAFRVGHTMVNDFLGNADASGVDAGNTVLSTSFGNTDILLNQPGRTVGSFCRGLARDSTQLVDRFMTSQLTNNLFPDDAGNKLDLASLNVQRGRDHGLAGYGYWRRFCGLSQVTNIMAITEIPYDVRLKLASIYSSPNDIDLFTAAMSETPVSGGLVGPTLACLLGRQFQALKTGDRFWFEEDNDYVRFTPAQLGEIRKVSLSLVICHGTNTEQLQAQAFIKSSTLVDCDSIPTLSLEHWREADGSWSSWTQWSPCLNNIRTKTRTCSPCFAGCDGLNAHSEACGDSCNWNTWGTWGTCINGSEERSRTCKCSGNFTQWKTCPKSTF
ncbi:peroxidase-like [Haliotis rufescens]|uniref:peroxidase-like n=1 Tax=Haliotis rufescens TaxID=6454 RepID=UPI00201F08D8|nr:peroxidase-like [Haliotis rufescens]